MQDYYSALGVSRDASQEEIKKAYRKKAKEYHPDISKHDDAEEKFKNVKKAYETLSDESARKQYDRLGHRNFEEAKKRGGGPGGTGGPGGAGAGGFGGFGGGGGGFEDIFDMFFGGGGRKGPRRGRDLQTSATVTLKEAFEGTEKQVTYPRHAACERCDGTGAASDDAIETCGECGGSGAVQQMVNTPQGRMMTRQPCRACQGEGQVVTEPCNRCNGLGKMKERNTVRVTIPPGIRDGQRVRAQGQGEAGERGHPSGDLYVRVNVAPHDRFERRGDELLYVQPVTFPQAVFGDTVRIDTFDGTIDVKVPPGTQSGKKLRLRGKGMPRTSARGRGDMHVTVQVVTPDPSDLDEESVEALQQYAEATGDEVELDEGLLEKLKKRVFN